MSGRGSPGDYRTQQSYGALGHHVLDSDRHLDGQEPVASSQVPDYPEGHRRANLTRHDHLPYTASSAELIRTRSGLETSSSTQQSNNSRSPYDNVSSLSERFGSLQAGAANPLSSQSPVTSLEDDREDDRSVDTDDEAVEGGQAWIEEDPTATTSATSEAHSRSARRFRLTHAQTRFLVNEFSRQQHPDAAQRERLSKEIPGLSPRQVQVWFQNRRAKMKRLNIEDQERMARSRALQSSTPVGSSVYSPLNQPLHSSTLPSSPTGLPSIYGHAAPFAGLSIHDHPTEAGDRFYTGGMTGPSSIEDPYNLSDPSLRTFSTRVQSSQPTHSYSPTVLSAYGAAWQAPYLSAESTQQSFAAYPPFSSASTSSGLNASLYAGSMMATPVDGSSPNPGYSSNLSYAGDESFTAYLNQASTSPYQAGDLRTAGPHEGGQYGTTVGYSTAPSQPLEPGNSSRRHDSINEPPGVSSTSYSTYPTDFTSTHMPHYHGYNG